MIKIIAIIGARPQFIKHAPIELYFKNRCDFITIHTGQHYDENMSKVFFDELGMNPPTYMLELGGGSHGGQTGKMLIEIEKILIQESADYVLVYGDTNSTIAGALAAAKLNVPVIHVEAGLRSFNKEMPEEINRILTDHVSSILICPTAQAIENLKSENIDQRVFKTGDIMCDMVHIAKKKKVLQKSADYLRYIYATIHRPYNTDNIERLEKVLKGLNELRSKVIFARHPRTEKLMNKFGLLDRNYENVKFISPVSYFENLNYMFNSKAVITDSGGMQKEAYVLKKKCITLRPETEWVETLENNWNVLIYDELDQMQEELEKTPFNHDELIYGDGNAAEEIYNIITNNFKI
jgi:UDP-GlcNAc3NAcA epimerase